MNFPGEKKEIINLLRESYIFSSDNEIYKKSRSLNAHSSLD